MSTNLSEQRPSIIIPTYNRAKLLQTAIQSVIQQTYEKFEIVISDGGSDDETSNVINNFRDSRIKYIKSNKRLTAAENYQQGLEHATGDIITFLSDDDVYTPSLLEKALSIMNDTGADVVGYRYCRYYENEIYDFDRLIPANSLVIENYDGSITVFPKDVSIQQSLVAAGLSNAPRNEKFIIPFLSNAIYKRDVFDNLLKVRAKVFDFVPPDMYLATAVFFLSKKYACVDLPLLVWRNWVGNYTATPTRKRYDLKEQYRRLMKGRVFKYSPITFPLPSTCGAECALTAMADFTAQSQEIDWATYFSTIYSNLQYLESSGIDVKEERSEFENILRSQSQDVIDRVNSLRYSPKIIIKTLLNKRAPKLASWLRRSFQNESRNKISLKLGGETWILKYKSSFQMGF